MCVAVYIGVWYECVLLFILVCCVSVCIDVWCECVLCVLVCGVLCVLVCGVSVCCCVYWCVV